MNDVVQFEMNKPQAKVMIAQANETYLLAGRATGKTTIVGAWILHKVEAMPGSWGCMLVRSYVDGRSKTLPPIFAAWKEMGHEEDKHFVFGRKPPLHWKRPYVPILDYSQVISFPNGTIMKLVSLHEEASANSNSFQWLCGPEAKFFNQEQVENEILPTLRGGVKQFGNSPWYGAILLETDKYDTKGNIYWLLKKRDQHNEDLMRAVIYWQLKYNDYRLQLDHVAESTAAVYRKKMRDIATLLDKLRRKLVIVIEASALDNLKNLGSDWIEKQRKRLLPHIFNIAILNKDPKRTENCFYAQLSEKHQYDSHADDDPTKPLIVAFDYQGSIAPVVACQFTTASDGRRTLQYLYADYVLDPQNLKDMVNQFCETHKGRVNRSVIYLYDHTAKGKDGVRKPYYKEIEGYFKSNKWRVTPIDMGQAPGHGEKHLFINDILKEDDPRLPRVRINKARCMDMITSMELAPLKNSFVTEKDKNSEKNDRIPQQWATHFSDVFDQLAWALLALNLYQDNSGYGGGAVFR